MGFLSKLAMHIVSSLSTEDLQCLPAALYVKLNLRNYARAFSIKIKVKGGKKNKELLELDLLLGSLAKRVYSFDFFYPAIGHTDTCIY